MPVSLNYSSWVEPSLRRIFGSLGVTTARAPYLTIAVVAVFLGALSIGISQVEIEGQVNDLVIARRGRIAGEKDFFQDNFDLISPVLNSVIISPKPGVDIFSQDALDEVYALQESIRTFQFVYRNRLNVSLEQFCFKTVNADPLEPCWQSSLLESFREGAVFNIGGERNTQYAALFASRPSYRDFNFTIDLKRSFLARTNLNPDSLLLGDFEVDEADGDTITSVGALQIAFGAKSPEGLMNDGLQYFEWNEVESSGDDADACSDPTRCAACAAEFDPTQFLAAGCTIDGSNSQPDSCCAALRDIRASPCIETVFEQRPEFEPIANPLFEACELERVELSRRCNNQALISVSTASAENQEVCVCLQGASDECTAAAGAYLAENPDYTEVFTNAQSGDEEDVAELGRVLVEEISCAVGEDEDEADQEVCVCLAGASDECTAAAGAFLAENPDYTEAFTNAQSGDEADVAELARVLTEEIGCSVPKEAADAEGENQEVCVCLQGASDECTAAAGAFLAENPDYTEAFTNAQSGDEEDVAELARVLTEEIGCSTSDAATVQAEPQAASPSTTYRAKVTVIRRETNTIDKARDLMHEWEKAWRGQMDDAVKQYQYIDVVWITSTAIDDEVDKAAEPDWELLSFGYALVFGYLMVFCTFDWKLSGVKFTQFPPGPLVSLLSFLMVVLSVVAAMGVAGYISAASSFKVMFSTLQQIPLLMMGLGVNDFFVLCSSLRSVMTRPTCPDTVEDIMYETMAAGGASISLSSAANAVAFALATISPVPIVLWYGVQMSVSVVVAYIVAITAIPSLLSLSVKRHLEGRPDPLLQCIGVAFDPPKEGLAEGVPKKEGVVSGWIRRFRWPITFAIFAAFAVWMAFGIRAMVDFQQGLDFSESVEEDSYTYNYLIATEKYFDTTQINIVFRNNIDYADPNDFQSVRQSEFEYVDEAYRVEKQLMTQSWMEFYTQYVEGKFCSNEICMNEVEWYYDGFSSAEFAHPSRNICAEAETPEACQEMCQTHCPQGPEDSDFRCQYIEGTTRCFCPYRPKLVSELFYENPDDFDGNIRSFWSDFLVNSTIGRASRIFVNLDDSAATEKNPMGVPKASRAYVYARGLQGIPHQLDHIDSGHEILDRQEVDVYAFDYQVYAIGEQYEDLAVTTVKNVGIAMAVATVVMMPLIVNFLAACIVSICVLLSVLLTIGTTAWTVINLDFGTYVNFIAAVGLSVEFCAHIARAFMLAKGDRLTRTLEALNAMGIAVFNGGITTFLGIIPSLLSYLQIVQDRLFVQFSIIVATGLFIGLLFMPAVLSLIGPPPFDYDIPKSDANEKQKSVEGTP